MKQVLFVANLKKDKELRYSKEIIDSLVERNIDVFVVTKELEISSKTKYIEFDAIKQMDLLLVLGGDGTILVNARKFEKFNLPIIGINLGRVGALAVAELDNYQKFIDEYLNDNFAVANHLVLDGQIVHANNEVEEFFAFNDVVLHRGLSPKILGTKITINSTHFSDVYADGIIISTPIGSSAYNLSAGGPLLLPSSNSFVITPICHQTKTFSSLVVSKDDTVRLMVNKNHSVGLNQNVVTVDGDFSYPINEDDVVIIKKSDKNLKLIQFSQQGTAYESPYKSVVLINRKDL